MRLENIGLDVIDEINKSMRSARAAGKMLFVLETDEVRLVDALTFSDDAPMVPLVQKGDFMSMVDGTAAGVRRAANIHWGFPEENQDDNTKPATLKLSVDQQYILRLPPVGEENDQLMRQLRCIMQHAERSIAPVATMVVLYGDSGDMPTDLLRLAEIINVRYPRIRDIRRIVDACLTEYGYPLPREKSDEDEARWKLARQLRGFTCVETMNMMMRLLTIRDQQEKPIVFDEKRYRREIQQVKAQSMQRSGSILELISDTEVDIGGLKRLKEWIKENKQFMESLNDYEKKIGPARPMGLLLNGVPGSGKSDVAKYLAHIWEIPLIRLDFGHLMDRLVGESERKLRKALNQLEAMDSILWIDEIEKSMSGIQSSGDTDGGTTQRMLATLLTWMQEREARGIRCFIYATANRMTGLPPELTRFGRIDEKFSVMLPTHESCRMIFEKLMQRAEAQAQKIRAEESGVEDTQPLFDKDCYIVLDEFISGHKKDCTEKGACVSLAHPDGEAGKRKPMFVSGTDIKKIVQQARKLCVKELQNNVPELQSNATITKPMWEAALRQAISPDGAGYGAMSVTSTGYDSMEGVAISYIHMLRGNFIPAEGGKYTLFAPEDYTVSHHAAGADDTAQSEASGPAGHGPIVSLGEKATFGWAYDQLLYDDLRERIERLGGAFERQAELKRTQQ